MAAVIIRKKDLDRLAKNLLKEVYNFLHDKYILTFLEMKKDQEKFKRNIILTYFRYYNSNDGLDENKYEEKLKVLKDDIENEVFSTEVIFHTLNDIGLDSEIDGDLYFKKESFLDLYRVFETGYTYLED